jgi:hypothetical protein
MTTSLASSSSSFVESTQNENVKEPDHLIVIFSRCIETKQKKRTMSRCSLSSSLVAQKQNKMIMNAGLSFSFLEKQNKMMMSVGLSSSSLDAHKQNKRRRR